LKHLRTGRQRRRRLVVEGLETRAMLSAVSQMTNLKDVFYIEMENHDFTEPSGTGGPQSILNNPAAPYLKSLLTPGDPNAAQTSYASSYNNVFQNGQAVHPSEPNYVWQEAGLAGKINTSDADDDPYQDSSNNVILNSPNLSALPYRLHGRSGCGGAGRQLPFADHSHD
jgi:hypothetical protein